MQIGAGAGFQRLTTVADVRRFTPQIVGRTRTRGITRTTMMGIFILMLADGATAVAVGLLAVLGGMITLVMVATVEVGGFKTRELDNATVLADVTQMAVTRTQITQVGAIEGTRIHIAEEAMMAVGAMSTLTEVANTLNETQNGETSRVLNVVLAPEPVVARRVTQTIFTSKAVTIMAVVRRGFPTTMAMLVVMSQVRVLELEELGWQQGRMTVGGRTRIR